MAADVGGIAIRPGAFDQGPAGRRVAGVGDAPLAPPFPAGVCRRQQAQAFMSCRGVSNTGQIAQFGHDGDGHGELDATQGLEGLDHRRKRQVFTGSWSAWSRRWRRSVCSCTGPDICLEDDLLGWGRTDHGREPPEVGRAPSGPARVADVLPEQEGVETEFGGLELAPGIFAGAARGPAGVIRDLGTSTTGSAPLSAAGGPVGRRRGGRF